MRICCLLIQYISQITCNGHIPKESRVTDGHGNPLLLHETIVLHFVGVGSRMMMLIDPTWYGQLSSSTSLRGIKVFQTPTSEPFPCFSLDHGFYCMIYIYILQSCCSKFILFHHNKTCFLPISTCTWNINSQSAMERSP